MRQAGSLLLTSHYEGSPTVLVEANATGLPVASTKGADPDGALIAGKNGLAVDSRNPHDLAKAVIETLAYSPSDCVLSAGKRSGPAAVKALLATTGSITVKD
jgi:glycosyltransferase involved in cell wall biosynthesis